MRSNNKGITLLALVITIILMIIIFSISIYEGKKLIEKSRIQTIETNMLTIQAKVKSYSEEIEAKIWTENEDNKESARISQFSSKHFTKTDFIKAEALNDSQVQSNFEAYTVGEQALVEMGLEEIKDDEYVVLFDKGDSSDENNKEYKLKEVLYLEGIKYNSRMYYSLSALSEALRND